MSLPIKTQQEVFEDMVAYALSKGSPITDFDIGTVMGEMFRSVAWKVAEMYQDARIQWEQTLDEFIYFNRNSIPYCS